MITVEVYTALTTVDGLKRGRSEARETAHLNIRLMMAAYSLIVLRARP
jgi:hypothetical protein